MADKLRAGLVGLSGISYRRAPPGAAPSWGTNMPHSHASAYHYVEDTELVAGCDLLPELNDGFKAEWRDLLPELRTYTDYREMLAKEKPDIVSVATGDDVHSQIVVDAVEAGVKGILCEKPIASTLADADRAIAAVERAGIPMLVDHTRRWQFPWAQVGELIRQGEIGDVVRVVCQEGGPRAMLFRNGTHACDTILWYAGGHPTAVYAVAEEGFEDYGPRYASDGGHDPDTDPAMSVLIEFDNDVRAFWNMCKTMPGGIELEVRGTKGWIRIGDEDATITHDDAELGLVTKPLLRTQYTLGHIAGCVTELVHLIRHGGTPFCGGPESRRVLEVLLAALQSQARGNLRVQLPIQDA